QLLLPVFVVEIYQKEADAMGLLAAVAGAGSLGGALFVARIGNWRRGPLLIAASFVIGTVLLLMSVFPHYLAAVGLMLFFGLGGAPKRTLIDSLAMDSVEDEYRGRVMSVLMMTIGLVPLGVLPLGLAADVWGARSALAIMAGVTLAVTSLVTLTQKRLREAE
ncbi:MAG: MFS transporter, partial [Candidatus Brocadiia bacterium]|nr:MFS transporter [Candidatus Brocadiia bacterium]